MKPYRMLYLIIPVLVFALNLVALAGNNIDGVTSNEIYQESDFEDQNHLEDFETPWLDSKVVSDVVYFIFQSPARIERYDLITEQWLYDIPLGNTPTAFEVDDDGIYISFGRNTYRFNLDGTGETHLQNSSSDVSELFTYDQYLYIQAYFESTNNITSVNKFSGAILDSKDLTWPMLGVEVASSIGKAFGRTIGLSPSDIVSLNLNNDGTIGDQDDSPYHGDYPDATKTFLFPGEVHISDTSGIIYNTNNLNYVNSLAGSLEDLAFNGDLPIVLRHGMLIAYSDQFLETGRYTPEESPLKIYIKGDFIFSFFDDSQSIGVAKISINMLEPAEPGQPVDPNGLRYVPDSVLLGNNEVLYLLSNQNLSIFRWSVTERSYLETIPLIDSPSFMTYTSNPERIYLAHPSGKITKVDLDQAQLSERPFVNSPQTPCGLSSAGEFLFVCDPSGAWESHFTYNPEGELISQVEWNYFSEEYIWSEINRKMYFFRDRTSPNDLIWEDIDENGLIGASMDSPYHSDLGIKHPIRVAPDGSIVILGSGWIYDAISLEHIDTLPNTISDGVWSDGVLFTLNAVWTHTQIQKWGVNYSLDDTQPLRGFPIRFYPVNDGLLCISNYLGRPWFSIWDNDLNLVYQPSIKFLPMISRE